jgi:hypothetical protein
VYAVIDVLAIANIPFSEGAYMATEAGSVSDAVEVPASLQKKSKEPKKQIQFNVPLSWWEELTDLSREFDQDVATFLRKATEEWLRKARKVRQQSASGDRT